jgi:pyruvate/2-oxoglutarate dehydrogenase complex dihydrolipoamide acyltransferase (E2) component
MPETAAQIVFVTIPQETVNDESVRLIAWKVPSGTQVEKDQAICEVETSKAVMDIEAPEAGVVLYTAVAGDEVPVGATICRIVPEGASVLQMAQADPVGQPLSEAAPASASTPRPTQSNGFASVDHASSQAVEAQIADSDLPPARLTPLAAKLAAEFGYAKDSFPRGLLVRRNDVLRRAGKLPPEPAARPAPAKPEAPQENPPVPGVEVQWSDLPRRKLFEAKVLGQGHARTIQSQVACSVRISGLRARLQRLGLGENGLAAVIVFEAARLLRKYPEFNAVHDRGRVGLYQDVNIGWAIDGGMGLMVPVIAKADQKTPHEIVERMQAHIDAYVESKLGTSDFLGGTFTVSDLSADGISHFHPLISQGQSAILGIGGDFDPAGREELYLTLAFDHQVTEGRKAAQFLRDLATRLETHAALEQAPAEAAPYCVLCQRDAEAVRQIRGILVRSEVPPGHVCSLCLAGFA